MQLTADISMYPLREDFIPPIDAFIERIHQYPELKITRTPTSTIVQGEYEYAMQAVQDTIAACHADYGLAVYVVKYIPGYQALD